MIISYFKLKVKYFFYRGQIGVEIVVKEAFMNEEKIELLKSINNGKVAGAKRILAKKLKVSDTTVGTLFNGKEEPSFEMLAKLAKVFNKPEKELQKIFEIKNSNISNSNFNINLQKELELKDKEIYLLKKEIELKNKEIELLKK